MINETDVVIVGTGASGLFCALNIPRNLNILMITKDAVENSDSYLAQGGIATLKNEDDYSSYFKDTMRAGHYKNNKQSVDIMIKSSPEIIADLIQYGVNFDMMDGKPSYTREGAHSDYRILHHKDITGKEITSKLLDNVNNCKNITIEEYTTMLDITVSNKKCTGIIVKCDNGHIHTISAKVVVWATGGIGGLFKSSTNFSHLTADSIAIAIKHKIIVKDINYIQIHPTTLYSKNDGRRFLISESVRGEGAILLNENCKRFVDELLPRDVVSTAILEQMKKFNKEYVYLSVTHIPEEKIKSRFPNIYEKCLEEGYDMTKEKIPITPAQHYLMGGVNVDINSKTSMDNLFAIGETSCNGVHGANRLASNSLLESLVFAKRAAHLISREIKTATIINSTNTLENYNDVESLNSSYKNLILDEIKRKDEAFYVKWCNY